MKIIRIFLLAVLTGCGLPGLQGTDPIPTSDGATPTVFVTQKAPGLQEPLDKYPITPTMMTSNISGWVVYSTLVSHDPYEEQIFLKNLESGDVTQLTDTNSNTSPMWSPDGLQILYLSYTKEKSDDIYLMEKDGKHPRPIVSSTAHEGMADWSPDGRKIAYVSDEGGEDDIYLKDIQSTDTVKLTNSTSGAYTPAWSGDGKYIAYAATGGPGNRIQLFVMNADGTNVRQLTPYDLNHFDGDPVWCPDDSCIIFTRFVGKVPKLFILDVRGIESRRLFDGIFDPILIETNVVRSPSRGYLTFSIGEMFYAMDQKSSKIYPLGVKAMKLSLYP